MDYSKSCFYIVYYLAFLFCKIAGRFSCKLFKDLFWQEHQIDFLQGSFIQGSFYRSMEEGKATFLMNEEVMSGQTVSATLLDLAIAKEKAYWENKE